MPLIVTLHGYDILVDWTSKYGVRHFKQYEVIVRKVLTYADAIIVASNAVRQETLKLCKCYDKIYLIPNGVDILRFNPNLDGSKIRHRLGIHSEFVIFTVRHHEPKYGIEYLIRAIPLVLKKRDDVRFIIGGDGLLRRYHEKLARKLGVDRYVIFTGTIPMAELPFYYVASDVVVVPSLQEA